MKHSSTDGRLRLSHRGAANTTLRVLGFAIFLDTFLSETIALPNEMDTPTALAKAGLWLLFASQALTAPALLLRRGREWMAWSLLGMLTLSLLLLTLPVSQCQRVDLLVPGYWVAPILVVGMLSMERRHYIVHAVSSAAALTLATLPAFLHDNGWSLRDSVYLLQPIFEVMLFGDALIIIAVARDRSLARHVAAEHLREQAEHENRSRREAARMLHDHILHALHSLGSGAQGGVQRSMAVEECRQAHAAMTQPSSETSFTQVETLIAGDPVLEQSGATLSGSSHPVPQAVAEALSAATHEALNNVVRHAHAQHTSIEVSHRRSVLTVTITDDGDGFETAIRPLNRFGVSESIIQRLDDVGGEATLTSSPGQGTTIELMWPRPRDEKTNIWSDPTRELVRRRLTLTTWPGLLAALLILPSMAGMVQQPALVLTVSLAVLLFGAALAVRALYVRLNSIELVALGIAALVGWGTNLWAVPEVPADIFALWMAWGASALVHLIVLSRRTRVGIIIFIGWTLAIMVPLWFRYPSGEAFYWTSSLYAGGAGDVGITVMVLAVARRLATQNTTAALAASHAHAAAARLQRLNQLDQFWSERVTDEALPLIEDIARERVAPDAPGIRERALALESTLRDELVLGPEQGDLLAAMAAARKAGWHIQSMLSADDSDDALARGCELLGALGDAHVPGQVVTLSTNAKRTTAVILDTDMGQWDPWGERMAELNGTMAASPDFVRLSLPHTTPLPLR